MLDCYTNTAISNVRVVMRVPNYSSVAMIGSLSAEKTTSSTKKGFYKMAISLKFLFFFFHLSIEKNWTQTNHKHELKDK